MILKIVFYVLFYILVFFVNRGMYLRLQKLDEDWYPNPVIILMCFFFLFGTVVIGCLYIGEINMESNFFKYKPKDKKSIDTDDKRGWDGC